MKLWNRRFVQSENELEKTHELRPSVLQGEGGDAVGNGVGTRSTSAPPDGGFPVSAAHDIALPHNGRKPSTRTCGNMIYYAP